MMVIGTRWFTGLAGSIWARPVQIATGMDIDSTPSREEPRPEIVKPKRKLADDAVVEVEKRRCGYLSRILRPMRRMKPNTQQTSPLDDTPTFLYQSPVKAERKRPCSSISEIPKGKRTFRYNPYSIPNRQLHIPLLLRRPHSIFPRAEGKHSPDEGFEQAPSKKPHKGQDNHPHDDDCCCSDSDNQETLWSQVSRQGGHNPNRERERDSTSRSSSELSPTSPVLYSFTSNIPPIDINAPTSALRPFKRRRRRSRVPRPVTFRLESLNINREEWDMEGVETSSACSDTSGSSIGSDDSMDLEIPNETTSRPISFFLRQIENFMSRPPRSCAQYPYSPWGPLSI